MTEKDTEAKDEILSTDTPWAPADRPVAAIDLAFSLPTWREVLPPYDRLPVEYKRGEARGCKFVTSWFYHGVSNIKMEPKPGVTEEQLGRVCQVVKAIIGSFEPKHEHKIGGLGFIIDSYVDELDYLSVAPDI